MDSTVASERVTTSCEVCIAKRSRTACMNAGIPSGGVAGCWYSDSLTDLRKQDTKKRTEPTVPVGLYTLLG